MLISVFESVELFSDATFNASSVACLLRLANCFSEALSFEVVVTSGPTVVSTGNLESIFVDFAVFRSVGNKCCNK